MERREFVTLFGSAAARPFLARGQEPGRTYHLRGLLTIPHDAPHYVALLDELR
jgi:hypothetical protein